MEDWMCMYGVVCRCTPLRPSYMGLEEYQDSKNAFCYNGSATYFDLCSVTLSRALYVSVDCLFERKRKLERSQGRYVLCVSCRRGGDRVLEGEKFSRRAEN